MVKTEFGKNRVQFNDDFREWVQYESPNFRAYWYGPAKNVAQAAVQLAEYDHAEIQSLLEHKISSKIEIIVYTDLTDIKQANIGDEEVFPVTGSEHPLAAMEAAQGKRLQSNLEISQLLNGRVNGFRIFVYFDGNHQHLRRQIREGIATIVANFPVVAETPEVSKQELEVEYVHRLFRRIIDEDVDFMGLSRFWCRPDWMICTVLRIPPPQVRPSVIPDNNQRSEDDLTHKLFDIIKNDLTLKDKIEKNAMKKVIDDMTNVVQYHVATLVDNNIPGVAPSAQRSGRPLKSIQQRLGGKEGRIRYNIQGKRVEFSARSVITPDPNISVAEIGVPLEIAMNLTSPERVTPYNIDKLYKIVRNGADVWPGAKTIVRKDGRMISLKHVKTEEIVLYEGDLVNRHLIDNDILLFNRQPTLHKMSMMGHRVKVLPYKTFRMNVLVTRPYNADEPKEYKELTL